MSCLLLERCIQLVIPIHLDLIEIDDSPPSPVSYWVPELKLKDNKKKLLVEESPLTDRHMNGTCNLIREQFPDIPVPQTTLRVARPELIKEAEEKSFFFHHFCEHWALSHIRDNVVYLYDSLQPKSINSTLAEQLHSLYGNRIVKIPQVQLQKGNKDCGCFAIAFCVSLMFGDDPATLCYDQKEMRKHLMQCFETKCFSPFPSQSKKSRIPSPLEIKISLS